MIGSQVVKDLIEKGVGEGAMRLIGGRVYQAEEAASTKIERQDLFQTF